MIIEKQLIEIREDLDEAEDSIEITEKVLMKSHREVEDAEKRFRDIVFSMADWIWEVDEKGIYTHCSEKVKTTLGYDSKEIIGKTPFDLMPPEEAKRIGEVFLNIVKNKEIIKDLENWNLTKDDKQVCLLTNGVPILDEKGNLKGYRGVDKNITERKRMEEALRQNENYLKTILNSVQTGVMIVDAETHLIADVNPVIIKAFGAPKEQIVGAFCHQYICPAEKEKCPITDLGQTVDNTERVLIRANGERMPVLKTVVPIILNNHKFLLESFTDITARKRYEEKLAKINSCFLNFGADAFKNIQDLTVLCGEILGATCALYNRLEGGLLCSRGQWNVPSDYNPIDKPEGHICYDVIKQDNSQPFIVHNLLQTSYAQTDPNVTKYQLQTYMGRVVKCGGNSIGSICVVYQNDFIHSEDDKEFLGIIASAIGVEEGRKRAEDQLKTTQSQLLQSSKMAAVGQLAGGVAHEINNPMGVILGFAQSVVKMLKPDDPLTMPLKSIEREAIRCKKLIGDLLTFSRAEKTSPEIMDINGAIEETLSLVETKAKVTNIEIVRKYGTNLPRIEAHKNQIQQVIMNLCNNAIDAMPEGGKITITTRSVIASPEIIGINSTKQSTIEISVSDTGQGMTEEVKKHLFEPFFTTKEVGKGTGLGLSLCYEIVQKHNGTIEAGSEVGKGTTFTIMLPVPA